MKQFPIPSSPAPGGGERPPPQANDGDEDDKSYAKGGMVKAACYAQGGPVLGRSQSFLKTPNEFTTGRGVPQDYAAKNRKPASKAKGDKSTSA